MTTNVTQCVVEFEQQYYSPSDLTLFLEQTGLPTDTPVTVIGSVPAPLTAHTAQHDIDAACGSFVNSLPR